MRDFAASTSHRPDDTVTRKNTTSMLPQTRICNGASIPAHASKEARGCALTAASGAAFQLQSHCHDPGHAQHMRGGQVIVEARATMRRGDGHELGIDVGDDNGRPCGPAHRRVEQNTVVRVPQVPAGASQVTFPTHMLTLMAGSGVGHWRGTHRKWVKMTCLRTSRM